MSSETNFAWWHTGIIYQIYPRSFQDSDDNGIGDLRGILQRLDYLQWLGVDAIWVSPFYPSPMKDFGYDVQDYTAVDPIFGNMQDFEDLLAAVHDRNMKLILDFVPNHTSDQHPWFLDAKSSKLSPKRDWYIWYDAEEDGSPPNNWLAMFGGTAWEWDEATQQYYYHAFLKEQPDLNWRNPEVQQAMMDVLRFWLDKGVDGFRVDVMWHMIKDGQLRNNPANPAYQPGMATYNQLLPVYSTDQPEVHAIVRHMRRVIDSYNDRMMIGEIYLPIHKLVTYYGASGDGAHLPFNFMLLEIPWDASKIAAAVDEYEALIPANGWPNWVLGNHDQPRIASRVGKEQAKIAAMLLLTLRGTPTVYYGDEIGMRDVPIPADEVKDPQGLNMPDKNLSRDPARTPMQWDSSENAGFSKAKPWMRLSKYYKRENVEHEMRDPFSMLALYKKLIEFRRSQPSLSVGNYIPVYADNQMLVYKRTLEGHTSFAIVLNFTHRPCYFKTSRYHISGKIVLATVPELEGQTVTEELNLAGDEGVIIELSDS